MILTGVFGSFTAQHRLPNGPVPGDGELHSHTWEVTAWFTQTKRQDARTYRAALDALLASWDGQVLPDDLAWGEDIAFAVGRLNCCVEVEVRRHADRLHARWSAV